MKNKYDLAMKGLFALAVILRLALFWVNPPQLALDDHYEPIFLILKTGAIPPKLACFQCYQPPLFYVLSALFGKILILLGTAVPQLLKFFQFLNCLFALLTIWLLYLILKKLPLTDFSRVIAFGTLCFLPRHIYMAAIHGNDTLSYLSVALCIYLLLLVLDGRDRPVHLLLLSVAMSAALFAKYTTFVVVPVAAVTLLLLAVPPYRLPFRKVAGKAVVVFLLPLVLFGAYVVDNERTYGSALPYNVEIFNPAAHQPRDPGGADFTSFRPWLFVDTPFLAPGQVSSFWTLLYGSMWFDTEPKYLMFMDTDRTWWIGYYAWMRGDAPFPGLQGEERKGFMRIGSALEALGLVPLFLGLSGLWLLIRRCCAGTEDRQDLIRFQMFVVLLLGTIGVVVLLTLKMPVYTAMKGSYLLNAMPAFGALIALGGMAWERYRAMKVAISVLCGALFLAVIIHISQLVYCLSRIDLYNR